MRYVTRIICAYDYVSKRFNMIKKKMYSLTLRTGSAARINFQSAENNIAAKCFTSKYGTFIYIKILIITAYVTASFPLWKMEKYLEKERNTQM